MLFCFQTFFNVIHTNQKIFKIMLNVFSIKNREEASKINDAFNYVYMLHKLPSIILRMSVIVATNKQTGHGRLLKKTHTIL